MTTNMSRWLVIAVIAAVIVGIALGFWLVNTI